MKMNKTSGLVGSSARKAASKGAVSGVGASHPWCRRFKGVVLCGMVSAAALLSALYAPDARADSSMDDPDSSMKEIKVVNFAPVFEPDNKLGCKETCGVLDRDRLLDGENAFYKVFNDLALIMAPPYGGPAKSIGEAGTTVQFFTTYARNLSKDKGHEEAWRTAYNGLNNGGGVEPSQNYWVGHLMFRKGLPNSFDIGGGISYLFDSNIVGINLNTKWAFLEGYKYAPDIAMRLTASTMVGVKDLYQVSGGLDFSISKGFQVGHMASLHPFLGYQLMVSAAGTPSMNAYPQDPRQPVSEKPDASDPCYQAGEDPNGRPRQCKDFNPIYMMDFKPFVNQRISGGINVNIWILEFGLEATYGFGGREADEVGIAIANSFTGEGDSQSDEDRSLNSGVLQVTGSLGVDF